MKKILRHKYTIALLTASGILASGCVDQNREGLDNETYVPLAIHMTIEGANRTSTKVIRTGNDDQWSYTDFQAGDEMGFYASGGNWQGNGIFNNFKLIYEGNNIFRAEDGTSFNPSQMNGNQVYMYFPYSSVMNNPGIELRVNAPDGSIRCIDMLSSYDITLQGNLNGQESALFGTFKHAFAELIIMRGEGFDSPPEGCERITAVIDGGGYTNIKVNLDTENGWSCTPQLVYDPSNRRGLNKTEATKWNAWQGENYGKTQQDQIGTEAWYVIVPTIGKSGTGRSTVRYIELYDNEGNLQRISSFDFYGEAGTNSTPSKYVDSGWRYPILITMKELVPTINPFPILPWEETIDLTDERDTGIHDISEFQIFVSEYNAYLADSDNETKKNALYKYGDLYVNGDTNEGTWHFYLKSDIDLSNYTPMAWSDAEGETVEPQTGVIIPVFKDIIDGKSSTLSGGKFLNYKLSGLNQTFVGNLSSGQLLNIDFVSPAMSYTTESPTGILATSIINGMVDNCNIVNGSLVNSNGPAGMVAGTMAGGTISNSSIVGLLIALSTAQNPEEAKDLIGTNPTTSKFENNEVNVSSYVQE